MVFFSLTIIISFASVLTAGLLQYRRYNNISTYSSVYSTSTEPPSIEPLPYISPVAKLSGEYRNDDAHFTLTIPQGFFVYNIKLSGRINKHAAYTLGYPSALMMIGEFPESQEYGQLGVCNGEVDFANQGCVNGGLLILYGIPEINGKGGYYNSEVQTINVDNQTVSIYYYDNGLLVAYPKHPRNLSELNIVAQLSGSFSREDALNIIKSIKFLY